MIAKGHAHDCPRPSSPDDNDDAACIYIYIYINHVYTYMYMLLMVVMMNMISLMAMATRLPVVTNVSNALDNRRKPPRQANYILHAWKVGSSPVLAWFLQSSSESPGGFFPTKPPWAAWWEEALKSCKVLLLSPVFQFHA